MIIMVGGEVLHMWDSVSVVRLLLVWRMENVEMVSIM